MHTTSANQVAAQRSTVLSLPFQLVFPAISITINKTRQSA
jgi:hypothetical protein